MKCNYLVSRTYSEVTPESAKEGDFSDSGFVYEDSEYDLGDLLRELRDCSELSVSPAKYADSGTWASTDYYVDDYSTMTERQESVHIRHITGRPLSARRIKRIFEIAGLIRN